MIFFCEQRVHFLFIIFYTFLFFIYLFSGDPDILQRVHGPQADVQRAATPLSPKGFESILSSEIGEYVLFVILQNRRSNRKRLQWSITFDWSPGSKRFVSISVTKRKDFKEGSLPN